MKLDIGCGEKPTEGYTGVDKIFGPVKWDAEKEPLPFEDNSIEEIRASHFLEHVSYRATVAVLMEFLRVLRPGDTIRPGGELLIEVPDLKWCISQWEACDPNMYITWPFMCIFGGQQHEGDAHKSGFTRLGLMNLVKQSGLVVKDTKIEWCQQHSCAEITLRARKP